MNIVEIFRKKNNWCQHSPERDRQRNRQRERERGDRSHEKGTRFRCKTRKTRETRTALGLTRALAPPNPRSTALQSANPSAIREMSPLPTRAQAHQNHKHAMKTRKPKGDAHKTSTLTNSKITLSAKSVYLFLLSGYCLFFSLMPRPTLFYGNTTTAASATRPSLAFLAFMAFFDSGRSTNPSPVDHP